MASQPASSFAGLLGQLRAEAGLTQEELAEAVGLGLRTVSDLERGAHRTAHQDTARLLADALGLADPARGLFVAAARGRAPAGDVLAARQKLPSPARHNLPAPLTSFLGRDHDIAELERLLGTARLVTLTGTGGAGKTRLALEGGIRVLGRFGDGVWLADLAGISDPGLVAVAAMAALGVRQEGGLSVLEALGHRLRSAELLLVLDNCEHLLDACAQVAGALLRGAPGLRILATSREPLGMAGEVIYLVRPLAVPDEVTDVRATAQAAAVRLFLDRGSAARGGTAEVAPAVVAGRICRKLDGLPLAIELAAARMGTLSAEEIEAHLADRVAFLSYRRPAPGSRHQGLQAAMDCSYNLLTGEEREVFDELSVFAGSFGLAQLAGVCAGGDQAAALEVIDRLAGKSLVSVAPAGTGRATGCWRRCASTRWPGWPRSAASRLPGNGTRWRSLAWPRPNISRGCWRVISTTSAARCNGRCRDTMSPGRGSRWRWAVSGSPGGSFKRAAAGWNVRSPALLPTSGCGRSCCGSWALCCMRPVT